MKKLPPKMDKLRNNVKGSKGYSWENGDVAFGKKEIVKKPLK